MRCFLNWKLYCHKCVYVCIYSKSHVQWYYLEIVLKNLLIAWIKLLESIQVLKPCIYIVHIHKILIICCLLLIYGVILLQTKWTSSISDTFRNGRWRSTWCSTCWIFTFDVKTFSFHATCFTRFSKPFGPAASAAVQSWETYCCS